MKLYLLRHGIAAPRGGQTFPNDDRPLTPLGVKRMRTAARGIARLLKRVDLILTSPLSRARETARITAEALGCPDRLTVAKPLMSGGSPAQLASLVAGYKDRRSLMLVGHEPDLSTFASWLLKARRGALVFKKGGFCRIDLAGSIGEGAGSLVFLLTPRQLRIAGRKGGA